MLVAIGRRAPHHADAPVLVRGPLDEPLALERVEPIQRGLVGRNLAAELNLADQGGLAVALEIPLDELIDRLLLLCQEEFGQMRLRRWGSLHESLRNITIFHILRQAVFSPRVARESVATTFRCCRPVSSG